MASLQTKCLMCSAAYNPILMSLKNVRIVSSTKKKKKKKKKKKISPGPVDSARPSSSRPARVHTGLLPPLGRDTDSE